MSAMDFLAALGPGFSMAFAVLTAMTLYLYIQVTELAEDGRVAAEEALYASGAEDLADTWRQLGITRGRMAAAASRAGLVAAAIPLLALVGTALGFFYAILATTQLELGGNPLALLIALVDQGVGVALATTIAGQMIYLLLGQIWAFAVAGPYEESRLRLEDAVGLVKARIVANRDEFDAPGLHIASRGVR